MLVELRKKLRRRKYKCCKNAYLVFKSQNFDLITLCDEAVISQGYEEHDQFGMKHLMDRMLTIDNRTDGVLIDFDTITFEIHSKHLLRVAGNEYDPDKVEITTINEDHLEFCCTAEPVIFIEDGSANKWVVCASHLDDLETEVHEMHPDWDKDTDLPCDFYIYDMVDGYWKAGHNDECECDMCYVFTCPSCPAGEDTHNRSDEHSCSSCCEDVCDKHWDGDKDKCTECVEEDDDT